MNPKHAQYMLTVYQEGSITSAAKKLFVSQPSLSQMIKLVENNLGTPIFNRSTDPLTLTYAGEKYIEAAQKILAINSNLEREIEEIKDEEHGKIRLGIPVQRGLKVLPAVLPRFYQDYPYVDIQIWEVGSNNTDKLLLDGTVDLACLTTVPKHDQINYILVEKEEMVLLASSQTELAKRIPGGTPISILEAKNEKFVSNKPGHSVRSIQDSLFITNNIRPRILIETSNIDIEKRVAIACGAVTICPLNYIEGSDGIGEKALIYPLLDAGNTRNCYICHRKDLYLTKYMCDFIRLVQETSKTDCSSSRSHDAIGGH